MHVGTPGDPPVTRRTPVRPTRIPSPHQALAAQLHRPSTLLLEEQRPLVPTPGSLRLLLQPKERPVGSAVDRPRATVPPQVPVTVRQAPELVLAPRAQAHKTMQVLAPQTIAIQVPLLPNAAHQSLHRVRPGVVTCNVFLLLGNH